ncbi:serine hydrolase domain-containing protein [Rhodococcus sp. OK519]|uniref:serine hydrolase domain-containing protein n=1 Tax=Rhodococcus sp. OK519 TaxID=2135729 RepID=UPI000D3B60F2
MNSRRGDRDGRFTTARRRIAVATAAFALGASLAVSVGTAPVAGAVAPTFNPGSRPGNASEVAAVTEAVRNHLAGTAGAAIAIVKPSPDNPAVSITTTYYFGDADKSGPIAVGPQTRFEIGSQTKTFTAALLAQQIQQGNLALNDNAQRLVPTDADVTVPSRDGKQITLRELAAHRSGLQRDPANMGGGCAAEANYDAAKLAEGLKDPGALDFTPGTDWLYSNWGFGLLGSLLTNAFEPGKPAYGEVVKRELTVPLGMSHTELEPAANPSLAVPYSGGVPVCYHDNTGTIAGAGGLVSTVEDMAIWAEATMGRGSNPLAPTLKTTLDRIASGPAGNDMQMGMAWQLYPALPTSEFPAYAYKDGTTQGSQSATELVPSEDWAVTVLTNERNANPSAVADQLREQLATAGSDEPVPAGSSGNTGSFWNIGRIPFGS